MAIQTPLFPVSHPYIAIVAIFILSSGCSPSPNTAPTVDQQQLMKENEELRAQLQLARQETESARTETIRKKRDLEVTIEEIRRLRGESAAISAAQLSEPIIFTDPSEAVEIEVTKILVGMEAVNAEKIHEWQVEKLKKQGKAMVYFEVRVTNKNFPSGGKRVFPSDFSLVDNKNNTYSYAVTQDGISATIHAGRSTTGGIAFEVYKDAIPAELLYDTGLVTGSMGWKIYAKLRGLSEFEVFKKIAEQ